MDIKQIAAEGQWDDAKVAAWTAREEAAKAHKRARRSGDQAEIARTAQVQHETEMAFVAVRGF